MKSRDYRDIIGGILLLLIGVAFSWYAFDSYRIGSLSRMGPGFFPIALGMILAVLGAILTVQGLSRPGELPAVSLITAGLVLGGIVVFAVTIRPLGLIPAICLLVIISSLAELRMRPASTILLCAALSFAAWLIFGVGLGLPVRMINWGA